MCFGVYLEGKEAYPPPGYPAAQYGGYPPPQQGYPPPQQGYPQPQQGYPPQYYPPQQYPPQPQYVQPPPKHKKESGSSGLLQGWYSFISISISISIYMI